MSVDLAALRERIEQLPRIEIVQIYDKEGGHVDTVTRRTPMPSKSQLLDIEDVMLAMTALLSSLDAPSEKKG